MSLPLSLELEPWRNLRQGSASPEIRLYCGYSFLHGLDLPCTSAHLISPQLTSFLLSLSSIAFLWFLFLNYQRWISQYLILRPSVRFLFLYLVKRRCRKELVVSRPGERPIYLGLALVFLSSSPSSFLTQQPVLLPVFIRVCYIALLPFCCCLFLACPLGGLCPVAHFVLSPVLSPVLSCRPSCPVARLVLSPALFCCLPCRSIVPLALWPYYFSCLLLASCPLCLLFSFIIPPLLRPVRVI